jgi:hypothetical protein
MAELVDELLLLTELGETALSSTTLPEVPEDWRCRRCKNHPYGFSSFEIRWPLVLKSMIASRVY